MGFRASISKAIFVVLACSAAGCADQQAEIDALYEQNERLAGELERTRDELGRLRLQSRIVKRPAEEEPKAEAKDVPPTTAELLKAIDERDREIEFLRQELDRALATVDQYRQAGERAVEQLNRQTQTNRNPAKRNVAPPKSPKPATQARQPTRVQVGEDAVRVTGEVPSSYVSSRGRDVLVVLMRDDEIVAQKIQRVDKSGKFDIRFDIFGGVEPGDYSAHVQLGY